MAHQTYSKNYFPFVLICLLPLLTFSAYAGFNDFGTKDWLNHGGDIYNRRYAENEEKISPETASKLRLKWKFFAGHDVTATPAIHRGILYFPSWNGNLYAVRARDGSLVWQVNLQNLTGIRPNGIDARVVSTVSRSTPTVAGDKLLVSVYGPAYVVAVQRLTGKLLWSTQLDTHNYSLITMSGTYYNRGFYVGTSSLEEITTIDQCCTFRGSFTKLDVGTGKVLWKTYMLPDNNGRLGEYAGSAIWGSSPSIDTRRNLVYIATGNLYSVPSSVEDCQEKENNQTAPTDPESCIGPDIHSESILALDLDSGSIRWSHQLGGYDVWFVACSDLSTTGCPPGPNPDADFGEAPMALTVRVNGTKLDIVAATQKSGFAWALDRATGNLIWSQEAGPGGITGGGIWGSATDQKRVYTNIANSGVQNFTLKPSTTNTTAGGWVAMDANTGKVLWSTANPANATVPGPVTVANGVLFGGSGDEAGTFYAMDARTGTMLWSYETGASVFGGASVSDGCVYTGSGYFASFGPYTSGTYVFAFCV